MPPPNEVTGKFSPEAEQAELNDKQHAQAEYMIGLYQELGRIAGNSMPWRAINRIMRHFPDWDYTVQVIDHRQTGVFERKEVDQLDPVRLPAELPRGRSLKYRGSELTMRIEDDVRGRDLMTILGIENQYLRRKFQPNSDEQSQNPEYILQKQFQEAQDVYFNEEDIFTDKEMLVLSQVTKHRGYITLGKVFNTSDSAIARIIPTIKKKMGIEGKDNSAYVELSLMAIAMGYADVNHIQPGITDLIIGEDRKPLTDYYSPDPDVRNRCRNDPETNYSRWHRLYKEMGVKTRHEAIMCAVKDGILELPEPLTKKQT